MQSVNAKSFRYLDDSIKNGNAEIVLDSDIESTPQDEADFPNGIKIKADKITIDGNGHTIDAGNIERIFEVMAGEVTLKNITLNSANSNSEAIILNGDRLKIIDSKISASKNGIYNAGNAVLKVENTQDADITNNGTLILIGSNASVMNGGLLYLPEWEMSKSDSINGTGDIIGFRKLNDKENSFTYLKNQMVAAIRKHYSLSERINQRLWDNNNEILVRVKYDVVLDIFNDECFDFPDGIVLDVDDVIVDIQGYAIDAKSFSTIFTTSAKNVTIRNMTLKNGRDDVAPAIRNSGGIISLSSITLENNRVLNNGGMIYNENNGEIAIERLFVEVNGESWAVYNHDGRVTMDYVQFDLKSSRNAVRNSGELVMKRSSLKGENYIENAGIMNLHNNNFEKGIILNSEGSILNMYCNDVDCVSNSLDITNHGTINAYDFENKTIPSCSITGGKANFVTADSAKADGENR